MIQYFESSEFFRNQYMEMFASQIAEITNFNPDAKIVEITRIIEFSLAISLKGSYHPITMIDKDSPFDCTTHSDMDGSTTSYEITIREPGSNDDIRWGTLDEWSFVDSYEKTNEKCREIYGIELPDIEYLTDVLYADAALEDPDENTKFRIVDENKAFRTKMMF